jgi:hypothetical protein
VDERRGDQPRPGTRPGLIASATRLSPVQEAYGDYTGHAIKCPKCRDIDRDRCSDGETLWRTYHEISDQAYRRLASE